MLKVSYSELQTFRTCRLAYWYRYVMNITRKEPNDVLELGSAFHQWAAAWYRLHPTERTDQKAIEIARTVKKDDRLAGMAVAFADQLGNDPDLYPVFTEVAFEFPLHNEVILEGYVDGVAPSPKGMIILEHKTGNASQEYLALMDEQASLYAYVLSQLYDYPIYGVLYNTITRPTERRYGYTATADRVFIERSATDGLKALDEAREMAVDILKLRDEGFRYRNRGKHCMWCDMNLLCMTELMGGDPQGVIEQSYTERRRREDDKRDEA